MNTKRLRFEHFTAICLWLLLYAAPALALDLPRAGINVSGYAYFGTGLPFEDVAHMDGAWKSAWAKWTPGKDTRTIPVNEQQYPTKLEANQVARSFVFTHNGGVYPLGKYTLSWQGDGDVKLSNSVTDVTPAGTVGKRIYNVTATHPNGLSLDIVRTNPDEPVRDVKLLMPDGFARHGFNRAWLSSIEHYGVVRYMDWNSTNNHKISAWKDRTTPGMFHHGSGVPYEYMIDLGNEMGQDVWITVPHLADDDYCRNLAELCEERRNYRMRIWVEYSNEVWNGGFPQYRYAHEVLRPKYGVANSQIAYGRRSAEVFAIFADVLPKAKLIRVLAGQSANSGTLSHAITGAMKDGVLQADVLAVAPYFTPDTDKLYQQHLAGTATLDDVFAQMPAAIDKTIRGAKSCKAISDKYGLPLVAYEGGQHLSARPGEQHNNAGFVELLATINRDPRMGEAYKYYLDQWHAAGGQTMCFFNDVYKSNKWGCWGLQDSYLDTDASKFKAVREYYGLK